MTDIVQKLKQSYHLDTVQPEHPILRAVHEIERLRESEQKFMQLAAEARRDADALRRDGACPHIRSTAEGTHHCALAAAPQPALDALREDLPELLRTRELELDALREKALQRMADEEGALGVDYTAPDALREACEWVMSCAEEYQQRAHRAERELLALREAARMALTLIAEAEAEPTWREYARKVDAASDALREALEGNK